MLHGKSTILRIELILKFLIDLASLDILRNVIHFSRLLWHVICTS